MDEDEAREAENRQLLERHFARAMQDLHVRAKKEAGYHGTYYLRMLHELGALGTARRLLASARASDGFTTLWERGRLDLTVEYTVLKPDFAELFTEDELEIARRRLADYGFTPN